MLWRLRIFVKSFVDLYAVSFDTTNSFNALEKINMAKSRFTRRVEVLVFLGHFQLRARIYYYSTYVVIRPGLGC